MRSYLVTGGAGFIGSMLVRRLLAQGHPVTVLDDLSSGVRDQVPDAAALIQQDISEPGAAAVVTSIGADIVIHAAAQVSVTKSVEDPERDHAVNVRGTEHVLAGAKPSARRFVFISSGGAIYGEADGATEETVPEPRSPYGHSKLAAEQHVRESGIPYAILRPSNVYGAGQRSDLEGGVVAIFADAVRSRRQPTIYGDGEQARDFVHVDDVVDAIVELSALDRSGTWNVATAEAITVHGLLSALEEVAGIQVGHQHGPERDGEVRMSRLSIDRIRHEVGWEPRRSLADGLRTVLGAPDGRAPTPR